MEPWLAIAIIAVFGVSMVVIFIVGYLEGKRVGWREAKEHFGYRPISQPTQPSGTHDAERGSDDTG